ncbi:hypothetical protein BGW42_006333 [Actinomortierella wolfii]|nr:hypothetical protein BGW42_006333 [Actinomortierella wolfii]
MKIRHLTICLALAAIAVVQANEAANNQPAVSKIEDLSDEQLVELRDEIADTASELEFRQLLLEDKPDGEENLIFPPPTKPPVPTPTIGLPPLIPPLPPVTLPPLPVPGGLECTIIKTVVIGALQSVSTALKSVANIPVLGTITNFLDTIVQQVIKMVQGLGSSPLKLAEMNEAQTAVHMAGKLIAFGSVAKVPVISDILEGISDITTAADTMINCVASMVDKGEPKVEDREKAEVESAPTFELKRCYSIADLYRTAVNDAIQQFPAVDKSSSTEQSRFAEGTRAVLDLMAKNTIANENENLLKNQAVFVGDLLDQYREEFQRVATTEEQKVFTRVSLSALVGTSNALEACLRVAADPEVAKEELKWELEYE